MTPKQEDALRDYLQEIIVPLIEEVLVKKLGQAMTFAKEELIKPKREWVGLTDDEIALIHADNPHPQGFARAILAKSKEKNCG
jgi:hypothetical protein